MKIYELGSLILLGVMAIGFVIGVASVKYIGPDNIIEESIEAVIEKHTGADIEFSPGE